MEVFLLMWFSVSKLPANGFIQAQIVTAVSSSSKLQTLKSSSSVTFSSLYKKAGWCCWIYSICSFTYPCVWTDSANIPIHSSAPIFMGMLQEYVQYTVAHVIDWGISINVHVQAGNTGFVVMGVVQ